MGGGNEHLRISELYYRVNIHFFVNYFLHYLQENLHNLLTLERSKVTRVREVALFSTRRSGVDTWSFLAQLLKSSMHLVCLFTTWLADWAFDIHSYKAQPCH